MKSVIFVRELLRAFHDLPESDQAFLIELMQQLNSGEISGDEFSERLEEARQ